MSRATGGRVHGSLIIIVPLSVSQKNYAQPKRRERKRELRLINTNKIHSVRKADELPFRLQKRIEAPEQNQIRYCPVCRRTLIVPADFFCRTGYLRSAVLLRRNNLIRLNSDERFP